MDALRVAAPLARLLLAVGEAGCDGEVSVSQRGRTAQLSLRRGRAVAVCGVDLAPLGDTLLALGALDVGSQRSLLSQHAAPLADGTAHTPIGARLIAAGATSSAAVSCALEVQLAAGIEALLRWPAARVELTRKPRACERADAVTVDVSSAVWTALLVLASELPRAALAQLSGHAELVLTGVGARRLAGLQRAIEAGELHAAVQRRGLGRACGSPARAPIAALEKLARELASSIAALREQSTDEHQVLRAVLRLLGAVIERPVHEDSYALLLRKRRQLSRNVSASALLDLPELASPEHARRALRRLAQKLHPDRFQAGDARLHAVSSEVMGALSRAEYALRVRESQRGARA